MCRTTVQTPISAEGTEEDLELPSTLLPRETVSQAPQHTQEKAAETRERLGQSSYCMPR